MARNREIGELMATKATHHLITDLAARSLLANDTAGASSPVATLVDDLTVLADGSTTRRDLSARAADLCFNVKDFGAIGNGIANDTTAILAAIAAAGIARADGLAIQVTWTKLYSELNAASQIALVGADQTTCPQNWLMLGYAAASNPATAGTAALYLENVRGFQAVNVWHESNANAEFILKSCKGVRIDGGRVSQTGTCDGLVIGFSGALGCGNISVDIPGWTNTGSKKRVDVSQFAGGSFQWAIRLGQSADGPITPAEVTGYASAFLADQIFFTPGLVDRVANIIQNGVTFTGTWTTATSLPKTDQRTAADNTTHQRGYYAGLLEGNALIAAVAPLKGRKPYAVDLIYEVTGADAGDDIDFSVATQPWPADNVATAAATAVTTTPDTAHNTAAKRSNSSGGHQYNRMRRTITTPAWLAEGEEFLVTISVVEANNVANALSVKIKAVLVYYYEANA
jgi:hypothetical protein